MTSGQPRAGLILVALVGPLLVASTLLAGAPLAEPAPALSPTALSAAPIAAHASPEAATPPSVGRGGVLAGAPVTDGRSALSPARDPDSLQGLRTDLGSQPSFPVLESTLQGVLSGEVPASETYLPDLALLEQPVSEPSQVLSPTYTVSPAPMGIADFGLSATGPYSFATPEVLGEVQLSSYNASAGPLYEDTGAEYWDGLSPNAAVTPWQSGVQLNTVVTNVSYPGSNVGVFWTQNVLDFSGSTLQLVDNLWNFSGPSGALLPGTLASYNGTYVSGDFYYDSGPTLPLAFPLSIDLYNNASTVDNRTTVSFGYRITEGSSVFAGTYDTVVFNSRPSAQLPLLTPEYKVDGEALNPFGLLDDAELVFAGPGAGSNAAIDRANGSLALQYLADGRLVAPRAAYDYGADTGETAIGLAATWSASAETVSQGPSLLYGLWNTSAGVPSGQVLFSAQVSPSYGFVFLGPSGVATANLSWAPTAANGSLATWLPPSDPPATEYALTAFADGFAQLNLTFDPSAPPAGPLAISLVPAPGSWTAPIYLNGEAQAQAFEQDALGSSSPALTVSNLSVHVNLTFNHLNDFGFPDFGLFWALQVSSPLLINDLRQGGNAPYGQTEYVQDRADQPYVDAPGLGSGITVWEGSGLTFTNLSLNGFDSYIGVPVGGAVSLWDCSNVRASGLESSEDSFGLWAVRSSNVSLNASGAESGAVALTTLDSPNATASNLTAGEYAADVLDEGGTNGSFQDLNATLDGFSFLGLDANDSRVTNATGVDGLYVTELYNSSNDRLSNVTADGGLAGVICKGCEQVHVDGLLAQGAEAGAEFLYSNGSELTNVSVGTATFGLAFLDSNGSVARSAEFNDTEVGAIVDGGNDSLLSNVSAVDATLAAIPSPGLLEDAAVATLKANVTTVLNVSAVRYGTGLYDEGSDGLTVSALNASLGGPCIVLNASRDAQLSSVGCDADRAGVELTGGASNNTVASSLLVGCAGYGVSIDSGTGNLVTNTTFVDDNGATSVYDPEQPQAYSVADNAFTSAYGIGNRWADWHEYDGPHLAPYPIANGVQDLDPIGPVAFPTTFTESGVPLAGNWTVRVAGGRDVAAPGIDQLTVWLPNGTWSYVISGPHDVVVSSGSPSGNVTVQGSGLTVAVSFASGPTSELTVSRSGLMPGEGWCVELGAASCTTSRWIVFSNLTPATYPYAVLPVAGYSLVVSERGAEVGAAGTVTVGSHRAHLRAQFSPNLYAVVFEEAGLPTGTTWGLNLVCSTGGHDPSGCGDFARRRAPGSDTTTVLLRDGSYTWSVRPVRGYRLDVGGELGWSGTLSVNGAGGVVQLTFVPTT